jgi:hypothetical protein
MHFRPQALSKARGWHPGTGWRDDYEGRAFCQQRLFVGIDTALVSRCHAADVFHQGFPGIDVRGAGRQ